MIEVQECEKHRLIGGALCLDFANTLNGHNREPHHEYIHEYSDLVRWCVHVGSLSREDLECYLKNGQEHPRKAKAVYESALLLRELIFRVFQSVVSGNPVSPQDLEQLASVWKEGQTNSRLLQTINGFSIKWGDADVMRQPLFPISASAINLLTSMTVQRIRLCAGDHCDWLFIDNSRNHLRRWCSMDECGNQAKMKRRRIGKSVAGN
jgi:predicted RNA-binding Zn ribbon-like protein